MYLAIEDIVGACREVIAWQAIASGRSSIRATLPQPQHSSSTKRYDYTSYLTRHSRHLLPFPASKRDRRIYYCSLTRIGLPSLVFIHPKTTIVSLSRHTSISKVQDVLTDLIKTTDTRNISLDSPQINQRFSIHIHFIRTHRVFIFPIGPAGSYVMEDPQQPNACIGCNKQTALVCHKCKFTCYCSQECQQTDFPIHELLCFDFAKFEVTARPTEHHIRAIVFPADQKTPKMIWLRCDRMELDGDNSDTGGRSPKIEPFFRSDFTIQRSFIKNNLILNRKLANAICICYCNSSFYFLDAMRNKCIEHITANGPGQYSDWTGDVVAYGTIGLGPTPGQYKDLDINDYRHITDYFLSCGFNLALPTTPCSLPKVKAVRINCKGDREIRNKPQFEQVELSQNDPIFTVHDTLDVMNRIGIPIFTQRCAPHPIWENDVISYQNDYARLLHISCDIKAVDWGVPTRIWDEKPGSAIMVRQDKNPLSLFQAEALCRYCCDEVIHLMDNSTMWLVRDDRITREFAMSMICRPLFTIFRRKLLAKSLAEDKKVDDMTCPYEV